MKFSGVIVSVLFLTFGHIPLEPCPRGSVIAIAAAAESGGSLQGVSGRPQKNGTVKGSPKPNASINGSQSRGKH